MLNQVLYSHPPFLKDFLPTPRIISGSADTPVCATEPFATFSTKDETSITYHGYSYQCYCEVVTPSIF